MADRARRRRGRRARTPAARRRPGAGPQPEHPTAWQAFAALLPREAESAVQVFARPLDRCGLPVPGEDWAALRVANWAVAAASPRSPHWTPAAADSSAESDAAEVARNRPQAGRVAADVASCPAGARQRSEWAAGRPVAGAAPAAGRDRRRRAVDWLNSPPNPRLHARWPPVSERNKDGLKSRAGARRVAARSTHARRFPPPCP